MKRVQFILVVNILIVLLLLLPGKSQADSVQFNSGKTVKCRILRASQTTLFIELQTSQEPRTVERELAIADLHKIMFSEGYFDSNGKLDPALSFETVAEIWKGLHPVITRPGNTVALVGVNLCGMMLESKDASLADHALKILAFIKSNACDPAYQVAAANSEIHALERLRRYAQAKSAAIRFEGVGNPLPLQLRANLTIGICGHEEMRLFLEDNPRWEQDPRVHKERQSIYEHTLDSYVFTNLFGGENEQLSGRALYQEALFHLLCGERSEANRIYKELSTRFQTSIYTKQLKDELNIVIQAY